MGIASALGLVAIRVVPATRIARTSFNVFMGKAPIYFTDEAIGRALQALTSAQLDDARLPQCATREVMHTRVIAFRGVQR